MEIELLANSTALLLSFVGVIILGCASVQIKNSTGKGLKVITAGIFLSVFCHAGFEMLALLDMIAEDTLFPVMGSLLSIGSLAFAIGGLIILNSSD
ncbi:hypothetical protein [Endozoicomonas sp.]|uniref:hypothetical protein n=1 Tax=Endozoicomonas sp. TaxID=1892382 RepID=UPI003AF736ED